ncbi:hypothetical protein [Microbispora triticiradicis]|uniref:hypothetical protein n=1 Tax=Microbispora triticiradicis TaxID=2200763 RepID=UPI001AD69D64|nr:hypothetical protein [Microbispora triticiradicis]MBO4271530.1 hypothetical protein [Microbispora triticiradicis]
MGTARKASAISAGALAIALGGGLPLVASPAWADCTTGGGLVSGLTGGVCTLVDGVGRVADGVTDVADKATGGVTEPVTKAVDDTVQTATGTAGTAVDDIGKTVDDTVKTATGAAGTASDAAGSASGGVTGGVTGGGSGGSPAGSLPTPVQDLTDGLSQTIQDTCLPLVAGGRCASGDETGAGAGGNGRKHRPPATAGRPARPKPSHAPEGALPAEPYRPGPAAQSGRTQAAPSHPVVDPDADGLIPLLWPGQKMPELPGLPGRVTGVPLRDQRSYDAVGTALTAALLLSAVLATRVVSARRARAGQQEPQESIPFEGGLRLPDRSGRHRLA